MRSSNFRHVELYLTTRGAAADELDRVAVGRCLAGQGDAFGDIVERYHRPLFNVAFRMLHHLQDAEDATQTVWVNAFLRLATYNPKYRFFSWIYRMTVNECLNALKRRKSTVPIDGLDIRAATPASDRTVEAADRVGHALMRLTPDDRAVVVLKHFVSFSYQEIADVMEITVKTVKSRLFTARERLRDALSNPVR